MTIINVQWRTYRLPFASSFTTAHGPLTAREGAIITVTTKEGITGFGEMAPLPAFGGESLAEACNALSLWAAHLQGKTLNEALRMIYLDEGVNITGHQDARATARVAPTIHDLDFTTSYGRGDPCGRPGTRRFGSPRSQFPSALCGLEIALPDALGKTKGCSVGQLLSSNGFIPRSSVPVNAVVGTRTTEAAVIAAQEAKERGFGCIKLKVGMCDNVQEEVERIAAVREAIGPDIHLRLDANEAWSLEQAVAVLSQCVPYQIQYIEQPLKADDVSGMRTLRKAVPIPIAADEAVQGIESARHILDSDAVDVLVLKPQLAGGLQVAQQIIQEAAQHGVQSVLTTTIEAGINLVATLHLAAASPEVTLECGLATHNLLADDLIVEHIAVQNGIMAVPAGAGLGVKLDTKALYEYK